MSSLVYDTSRVEALAAPRPLCQRESNYAETDSGKHSAAMGSMAQWRAIF